MHDKSEEFPAWVNSSAINGIDFQDPDLVFLVSELAPAILRIGGSEEDITVYALEPAIECEPVPHVGNFCLTADRWMEMTNFGAKTGARISFGLNAMYGRGNNTERFNSSQIEQMFRFTVEHVNPAGLYGFQFGNELEHKVDSEPYAQDLLLTRQLLNKAWPDAAKRPKLVAPDENPDADYVSAVLGYPGVTSDTIDGLTWHQYTGEGTQPNKQGTQPISIPQAQPAIYCLCISHPAPCTLHPAPCTLHPAPCTLHPAPCTLLQLSSPPHLFSQSRQAMAWTLS